MKLIVKEDRYMAHGEIFIFLTRQSDVDSCKELRVCSERSVNAKERRQLQVMLGK